MPKDIPDLPETKMTEEQVLERLKEKYPEAQIQASDMTGTGSNFQIYIKSPEFEKLTLD